MKTHLRIILSGMIAVFLLFFNCQKQKSSEYQKSSEEAMDVLVLDSEAASNFAKIALNCVQKQYPNKLDHVMNDETEVQPPQSLHPAFYGCFDWHSSVHGHWMLVRLLKMFPDLPEARQIRDALNQNLTHENISAEVAYLDQLNRQSFERTYGWAWLLRLAEELQGWDDADGKQWSLNLKPLADAIVARYFDFLPKQIYPILRGVHPNSAFGIAFALDYARSAEYQEFIDLLTERSLTYFSDDSNCPAAWEPEGDAFFSPCLMEADLMRRVMDKKEFTKWFHAFLPQLNQGEPQTLLQPATVSDRSDPKIVHLDGLNLSRAWCMFGIAAALPQDDPYRVILLQSAVQHAKSALDHVASGEYVGEHWLASFAVYMLLVYKEQFEG